jgi:hypothetical protein
MCGEQLQWQFYIAVAKDIIVAGASMVAAAVALCGLRTWRKQLTATTNAEVARGLLHNVYRVQDNISVVRNPFITGGEIATAFKELQITDAKTESPEFRWKADSAVYQVRFNRLALSISEMRSALIEAKALWGDNIEELCSPLLKKVAQLRGAIGTYLSSLQDNGGPMTQRNIKKIDEVLYDSGDTNAPDQFSKEINDVVKRIEESLRKRFPFEKAR